MPKRLIDSVGTGDEIMQNLNLFKYIYTGSEPLSENKILHRFDWSFDDYQSGIISIVLDLVGVIDNSSSITCKINPERFSFSIGAYKDDSLYNLFRWMLQSQHIDFKLT